MIALFKKEVSTFFTSPIGYLVMGLFLVSVGLFLWVFDGDYNIPNSGFASLSPFFELAPWIFIFLIPAITMRSISDEQKAGTLELLLTKPITTWQLVLGKYLGSLFLIIITLLPTLLYVVAIYNLGNPVGNLDVGAYHRILHRSYFSSRNFCSYWSILLQSLTSNQIVAFISAVCISFILFYGLYGVAQYNAFGAIDNYIDAASIKTHYESISRGVVDTRDLIYFISVTAFFIFLTIHRLKKHR